MFIWSFNLRGLSSELKKTNLFFDVVNYKLDIVALQETKIQSVDRKFGKHRLFTFDSVNTHYGLGFIVSDKVKLISHWSICDRIAAIRIEINSEHYTIFNVYAPHSVLTKQDPKLRDEFYNTLSDSLKVRKSKGDKVLICGDLNSKVGKIENDTIR